MRASSHVANPFDMLVNPQAVLDAVEHSEALERLERKVWRPLERAAAPKPAQAADVNAFDAALDSAGEDESLN